MKKIVSLLLCILLLCLSLASCSEDPIGEDLKNRDDALGRGEKRILRVRMDYTWSTDIEKLLQKY